MTIKQKMDWMHYLKNMSKALWILTLSTIISCNSDVDGFTPYSITFYFINNTNNFITIKDSGCGFDELNFSEEITITVNDTIIFHQSDGEFWDEGDPDINNIPLFDAACHVIYANSVACEYDREKGIGNITNYESRKKVAENTFEFVYRFTEETMNEAGSCK